MALWHDLTHAAFWLALARSDLATWIQLTPYAYAVIEGVHLVGIAFFFGPVVLLDLRLLGLVPQLAIESTGRFLLRITAPALALIAASGILMFVSAADRYAASPVFAIKMTLIAAGGVNALILHVVAWRRLAHRNKQRWIAKVARITAVVSLLVWVGVIVLGRWMGYEMREPPATDIESLLLFDDTGKAGSD